jgi:putative ABC transport system ATP-binding protein
MANLNSPLLTCSHLSKQVKTDYETINILSDVNFTLQAGESLAITGTSGSGKTTLLSILAGLDEPSSGEVYYAGTNIKLLDDEQRAKHRSHNIGFIFQSFYLLPSLTVIENVMLPLEIQAAPIQLAYKQAAKWLNKVGLGQRIHHYPNQLSGGEQQRVAIARAFINEPKIIFADEMTGNLDETTGELISDIVFDLNTQQQTTLVLVTHDTHLAKRCLRLAKLHKGVLEIC